MHRPPSPTPTTTTTTTTATTMHETTSHTYEEDKFGDVDLDEYELDSFEPRLSRYIVNASSNQEPHISPTSFKSSKKLKTRRKIKTFISSKFRKKIHKPPVIIDPNLDEMEKAEISDSSRRTLRREVLMRDFGSDKMVKEKNERRRMFIILGAIVFSIIACIFIPPIVVFYLKSE